MPVTVNLAENFGAQANSGVRDRLFGIEVVRGTTEADSLVGDEGRNKFVGGGGEDVIRLRGGDDSAFGGRGGDNLLGRRGNDFLDGGDGRDRLAGDEGTDRCLNGEVTVIARTSGRDAGSDPAPGPRKRLSD